jgi:outer membrane protein TolC
MRTKKRNRTSANPFPLTTLLALLLSAAASPATAGQGRTVPLTPEQAVARALAHNLSLEVERLSPALSDAAEKQADAAFEPSLYARVDASGSPGKVSTQRTGLEPTSTTAVGGSTGLKKTFSTGTAIDLSLSTDTLFGGGGLDPAYQSGASLTVRQPLLRGASRSANLADVTDAQIAREAARRALVHKAEQVAMSTLEAYFDLQAALASDAVAALAIRTSEAALEETRKLIASGKLPPSEEASARYALQTQQRDKLRTEQAVGDARDQLARLIGLVEPGSLATPAIVTAEVTPAALPGDGDLERLLTAALAGRGDYQAARREIERQQSRVSAARHQLLPSLDLVGSVFLTGLSGQSPSTAAAPGALPSGYWSSFGMDQVGWSAGLVFELPLGNDRAEAALKSAELALRRARLNADLVRQSIAQELNRAWRAARLARDELRLTELAAEVAETKLRSQEALYRSGKSSGHDLAAIRAEAVAERIGRAQAAAALNKAVARLRTAAGGLLPSLKLGA